MMVTVGSILSKFYSCKRRKRVYAAKGTAEGRGNRDRAGTDGCRDSEETRGTGRRNARRAIRGAGLGRVGTSPKRQPSG